MINHASNTTRNAPIKKTEIYIEREQQTHHHYQRIQVKVSRNSSKQAEKKEKKSTTMNTKPHTARSKSD